MDGGTTGQGAFRGGKPLSESLPYVAPGFFKQRYDTAAAGMSNSNNSGLERTGYFALATGMAGMMMVEEAGRGLMNAPRQIVSGLESAGRVVTAPTTEDKVIAGLASVRDVFLGAASLAPLVPANRLMGPTVVTSEQLALQRFAGGEASAAAQATYAESRAIRARVEAAVAESAAARRSSKFDIHLARTDQIRWGYVADDWSLTTLKAGDRVFGGLPGQSVDPTPHNKAEEGFTCDQDEVAITFPRSRR